MNPRTYAPPESARQGTIDDAMFARIRMHAGIARIRDLSVSVATVLERLASGQAVADVLADHPGLEAEDVREALGYAATVLRKSPLDPRSATHLDTLDRAREALGPEDVEKWLLIADGQVAGLFETLDAALDEARRSFPDGRALIAPVDPDAEPRVPWPIGTPGDSP